MTYDNDNDGAIFPNRDKKGSSDRDFSGSATVNGIEYWVSGWVNKSKKGTKYMKLRFTEKEEQSEPAPNAQAEIDFDADIPF